MPESPKNHLPESAGNDVPGTSPDFRTELAARLAELVPEAVADGKIDAKKLVELLGDDAADDSERFGLFWPGKKRALRAAQAPTSATLKPDFANSRDWDTTQNVFIEGDNLEVLKILQRHYHGKIKLIYIDPPYNTGKDFVYPDNFTEGLETYLEWTRQVNEEGRKVSTNPETTGRFHSNWLNMMYPRLKLARNLLTDDGVIFISIDDNEIDNLTKLGKEVFGEANHLNTFVWVSNLKGRQISASGAAGTKEYIVAFARNAALTSEFRASAQALKKVMPSIYRGFDYDTKRDEHGPYITKNELYNTNSAFNEVTRPNLVFDIYYRSSDQAIRTEPVCDRHLHAGFEKIEPKKNNNGVNSYHAYRWSKQKIANESHNLEFLRVANGWRIFTKIRDVDSTTVKDLIMDITTNSGSTDFSSVGFDSNCFDYPKPLALIRSLISFGATAESIVLDFFAGSSSTAHAVMQLNAEDGGNRRFIMVQLPEPTPEDSEARKAGFATIADISRKRITLAGEKIKAEHPDAQHLDTGFRAYKLTETHFAKWRVTSDITPTELEQHLLGLRDSADDDASQDELLTELLLKLGLSLTETITTKTIAGLEVRAISGNHVLAYVNEHVKPTLEQLRALVDIAPAKLIVLEDAFHGDDQLKTNLVQYAKTQGVELRTA